MKDTIFDQTEIKSKIVLPPGRGTKLYKNGKEQLIVYFQVDDKKIGPVVSSLFMVVGEVLTVAGHLGAVTRNGYTVRIPGEEYYMIMNTTQKEVTISFNQEIESHEIIYDPYKFEHEEHQTIKEKEFIKEHPVPEGYIDVLEKWYSIKFTYPDKNYIFIRPGLGISLQVHKYREEHWRVLRGKPIIFSQPRVYYFAEKGFEVTIPLGALHTVINPSQDEWVLIEETYTGKFDEMDIERVFNPNHYYA